MSSEPEIVKWRWCNNLSPSGALYNFRLHHTSAWEATREVGVRKYKVTAGEEKTETKRVRTTWSVADVFVRGRLTNELRDRILDMARYAPTAKTPVGWIASAEL